MPNLAQRLKSYVSTLAEVPGVTVQGKWIGDPAKPEVLKRLDVLPDDMAAFFAEVNGLEFEWSFDKLVKKYGEDTDPLILGGGINLVTFGEKPVFEEPRGALLRDYGLIATYLDSPVAECEVWLAYQDGGNPEDAFIMATSDDLSDYVDPPNDLEVSFTEYLQHGMSFGFNWYWPMSIGSWDADGEDEEVRDTLRLLAETFLKHPFEESLKQRARELEELLG